jgi:nucleotide-binding universal stress UspA family protein
MNIQTILWPTDLSNNSLKAGKHVLSLAVKEKANLIVLTNRGQGATIQKYDEMGSAASKVMKKSPIPVRKKS